MADTGAPGFLPLVGGSDPFTPPQAPLNAIATALNTALQKNAYNTYPTLNGTGGLNSAPGTTAGQHGTVNADPTARNNGDYVWSGSAWVKLPRPGTGAVTPTSVSGSGVSLGANGAITFSSATAASINGCFSADYDNYHIEIAMTGASATQQPALALRSGGADDSAGNYDYTLAYSLGSPAATSLLARPNFQLAAANPMTVFKASVDLSSPFLAQVTTITAQSTGYAPAAVPLLGQLSGGHRLATSFDGMTIGFTAACSGTIRVYGWNNN